MSTRNHNSTDPQNLDRVRTLKLSVEDALTALHPFKAQEDKTALGLMPTPIGYAVSVLQQVDHCLEDLLLPTDISEAPAPEPETTTIGAPPVHGSGPRLARRSYSKYGPNLRPQRVRAARGLGEYLGAEMEYRYHGGAYRDAAKALGVGTVGCGRNEVWLTRPEQEVIRDLVNEKNAGCASQVERAEARAENDSPPPSPNGAPVSRGPFYGVQILEIAPNPSVGRPYPRFSILGTNGEWWETATGKRRSFGSLLSASAAAKRGQG